MENSVIFDGNLDVGELRTHCSRDLVTLGEELLCIVLGYYSLHNLVTDGWKHTLIPISAQILRTPSTVRDDDTAMV